MITDRCLVPGSYSININFAPLTLGEKESKERDGTRKGGGADQAPMGGKGSERLPGIMTSVLS